VARRQALILLVCVLYCIVVLCSLRYYRSTDTRTGEFRWTSRPIRGSSSTKPTLRGNFYKNFVLVDQRGSFSFFSLYKLLAIIGCDFSAVLELRTLVTAQGTKPRIVQLVTAFVSIPVNYFIYQYTVMNDEFVYRNFTFSCIQFSLSFTFMHSFRAIIACGREVKVPF
jgi:hypothetical protein